MKKLKHVFPAAVLAASWAVTLLMQRAIQLCGNRVAIAGVVAGGLRERSAVVEAGKVRSHGVIEQDVQREQYTARGVSLAPCLFAISGDGS